LDGDRHARETGCGALGACLVDGRRGVERVLVDVQERVHIAVDLRDAVEVGLRQLDARGLAGIEQLGQLGRRTRDHCSSPRIEVTLKKSPSRSGAPASASSGVSVRPTTSGRVTVPSAIGWLVAGTSGVATSVTVATAST